MYIPGSVGQECLIKGVIKNITVESDGTIYYRISINNGEWKPIHEDLVYIPDVDYNPRLVKKVNSEDEE